MKKIIYLDHAATTAVREEVLKEMIPYFSLEYGNPSSIYGIGRRNKKAIENARIQVAKVLNCMKNEVYFTSCGSESDNLALKGIMYANKVKGNHIITTKIEHHAILNTCKELEQEGFKVTYLNVDKDGVINLNDLKNAINEKTVLISIMFANNEIGTIQPIEEIGKIAKENNVFFHTDAVQAVGNLKIDVQKMNIDALSMSAHKFYGPKGIGALYVKNNVRFNKIQQGGHQENDKRAGTENVAGIVGLGKAIEIAYKNLDVYNKKLIDLKTYYIKRIEDEIENAKINGSRINSLPGNINISFIGIDGEDLLLQLDSKGICVSTGSACNSKESKPSHVLMALGLDDKTAQGSIRVTFGEENTKKDVDCLINEIKEHIQKIES